VDLPYHSIPHHKVIKGVLTTIAIDENCMGELAGHVSIRYIDDSGHRGLVVQIDQHGMTLQHHGPTI